MNNPVEPENISEQLTVNKSEFWDEDAEKELLTNLVENSGLKTLPYKSPNKKSLWIDLTKKFNEVAGSDYDFNELSKKWGKWANDSENNECITDDNNEEDENNDLANVVRRRKRRKNNENEFLAGLVEKFGLYRIKPSDPAR